MPHKDRPIKRCSKCTIPKPLTEFHRATAMRDGHRNECKECTRYVRRLNYQANRDAYIKKAQEWKRKNPERHRESERRRRRRRDSRQIRIERDQYLRRAYGLTLEEFDFLIAAQAGECAICAKVDGERLHVDHDHATGRVRGLLCGNCNRAMGLFHEDARRFEAAGSYLRTPQLRLGSGDKTPAPVRKVRKPR